MEQRFGGAWTLIKLEVLEKYLKFYTTALKNLPFKLCYIDAFAGSGRVDIRGGETIHGSSIRALDYPFHKYYFFEENKSYIGMLEERISKDYKNKDITIRQGDCNELLKTINSFQWKKEGWRGVIFLDPYAMELKWESLKEIAKTEVFDVWYLFPLMAMNRLLRKDCKISDGHRKKLDELLGTSDWQDDIYQESSQLSLFGDANKEKCSIDDIRQYAIKRLKSVFPGVSNNSKVLTNTDKNSPMFLLCFAISNPSGSAIGLSLKAADHILSHT